MTDPSHTQASETAATGSHADTLAQRYGAKPVRQRALSPRLWVRLAACVTVVAGAFVVWVQIDSQSRPSARDTGFTLISNDEAQGRFELSKNPQDTAVCSLKALNSSRVAVGWADVEIGPNSAEQGNTRVTQHSANLRILSEATTVTVDSCRLK